MKCHEAGDFVMGGNRDWARVTGNEALDQKLIIYFGIPKGELLNDPEIGCCLHAYQFDKLTDTTLVNIMNEMEHELKVQIPELGLHRVIASRSKVKDAVKLQILGYNTWILNINRNDLLDIGMLDIFGNGSNIT